MSLIGEQVLLRAYLHSADRAPHTPGFERIVKAARDGHLAGATVLRGILGAGYHGVSRASDWSLTRREPVIVEIVDSADAISRFIHESLDRIMIGGIATLERAAVMMYRQREQDPPAPAGLQLASMLDPLSTMPRLEPESIMRVNQNGVLLRVFIGESDHFQRKPLYEAIVQKARELGLAGATVLRGSEGFGANSVVHKAALLEMSTDLPIVIEMVDAQDKVEQLLPHLDTMVREGMITMEHVMILMYRDHPEDPADRGE
jgi:PII-like signaling protein